MNILRAVPSRGVAGWMQKRAWQDLDMGILDLGIYGSWCYDTCGIYGVESKAIWGQDWFRV